MAACMHGHPMPNIGVCTDAVLYHQCTYMYVHTCMYAFLG